MQPAPPRRLLFAPDIDPERVAARIMEALTKGLDYYGAVAIGVPLY